MIVVGVGGNVGGEAELVERFRRAREALAIAAGPGTVRSAPLYRTAPIGPAQPAFLNTALAVGWADVQPAELLATVQELERLLGRDRRGEARWGPRPIDLDVLVWDDRVITTPELEIPHPRLITRRFALEPLVAVAGEAFVIPGAGPAGALLEQVRGQHVELVAETW